MKRAFLIYPPTGVYMRDDRCQAPVDGLTAQPNREPLDLGYMAANLERAGLECRIEDYAARRASWTELREDLSSFKPDMLVLSITTPTLDRDLVSAKLAKELNPNIVTVAKGAHFGKRDGEALEQYPQLDIAIRGESEFAVSDIAKAKGNLGQVLGITYRENGEIKRNPDRPALMVLDELPLPARHLINNNLYLTPDTKEPIAMIYTARGCPHQCIYCGVTVTSGFKLRQRSAVNVFAELKECVDVHKIRNFFFRADTFTMHKEWTIKLCQQIVEGGLDIRWGTNSRVDTIDEERLYWMKKAGCWIIGFGFESGNQEMLDRMKKNATLEDARQAVKVCRKHGIKVYGLFLLGLPWESKETAEDTIHFSKELNPDFADFNIAYPLPSTEFYHIARDAELFDESRLAGFDYAKPIVKTLHLTTEELIRLRKKALWSFYLRPSYIAKTLWKNRQPKVFLNYILFGFNFIFNQILFYRLKAYRTKEQDKVKEKAHNVRIAENAEFFWGWATPAGKKRAERRATMLIEKGNLKPGVRVLEIGCGTGLFTEKFVQTGATLSAIDLSPELLSRAEKRTGNKADLRVADAENLPFENESFDVVLGVCVLHHLNLDHVLPEFRRVLKRGGKLLFSEPNMLNPQIFLQKNIRPLKHFLGDTDDETAFVKWSLAKRLQGEGFENISIRNFDFLHPWTPKPLIPLVRKGGEIAEKLPLIKEISGSLSIECQRGLYNTESSSGDLERGEF